MVVTEYLTGSNESTMLGAFAGLAIVMVVLLLYIRNRKSWWWNSVSGMSCCDENCPPVSLRPLPSPPVPSSSTTGISKHKLEKMYSFDLADTSSESEVGCSRSRQVALSSSGGLDGPYLPSRQDLISLAEKGKVGMSSNSSCCSSTTGSVVDKHLDSNSARTLPPIAIDDDPRVLELRETKVENEGIDYQKSDDSADHADIASNRDCIVVMNTEHEERIDFMPSVVSENRNADHSLYHQHSSLVSGRHGHLEIALQYDAPMRKMTVHVLQARNLPSKDRGQPTHTQVRLILLPNKKQKYKTKIRTGENPQYMESFLLHRINPEDVNSMGLRLRLYVCERMRKERFLGEAMVSFANINLELENNFWLNLEPRCNTTICGASAGDLVGLERSDSTGSTQSMSMQHGGVPELLLGLCYNATTGRLRVEVVKGSYFRNFSANKVPDTYVKLNLVSSTGQELAHSKTTVRRGQPNPLFKENFIFQVALFQLADVTLMVSVYNRRGMAKKKEMVGWFSLGLNSSGAEELAHWMDMKEFQQQQISRWHVLVQA